MLSRDYLREHADAYRTALENRRSKLDLERFFALDKERRDLIQTAESLKNQRNVESQEIAKLKKAGQDATARIASMRKVGDEIKSLDARLGAIEEELAAIELDLPNVPDPDVPVGPDESANRVERTWGQPPQLDFEPKAHFDLGEALGVIDFDRAAKISGARFAVLFAEAAQLERALIAFMLDLHREKGYVEVWPPVLVNAESMRGTGQLPKFEQDLFKIAGEKPLYLISTAEISVTNLHRDEILPLERLPIRYCSYTACFRSEAGSYGKDTRGLIRMHQFDKVELVKFTRPDQSEQELETLTADAEDVLRRLGLHHRVVSLSTGDLGFSAAKTYDIEVWLPAQNTFREISSCSNFRDFQARRANIRFKNERGKTELVHTLNGSGLAIGRTLVAIFENYQQKDGSIAIPEALQPYLGGMKRIERKK